MRYRKMTALLAFVAAVVLLRQGLLWIDGNSELRKEHRATLENYDVEPAAMFYTEVSATRAAELAVRSRLEQP